MDTTDGSRRVQLHTRFSGAQPVRVVVEFTSAKGGKKTKSAYLHQVELRVAGGWSGTLHVPPWLGDQTLVASLYANFGPNYRPGSRGYDTDALRRLDLPTKLAVVSGVDDSRPTLTSLSFSPPSIDSTHGAEQVTVTATATDTGSGVRSIEVGSGIRHGENGVAAGAYPHAAAGVGFLSSENFQVRLKKAANGDWVGVTKIKRCVPSGLYKLSASLVDRARNYHSYSTKDLAKAGITSTVDVKSKHGDVVAPYVYSAATYGAESNLFLDFSEGVANVSTTTLTVYPMSPKSTRFTTPATVTEIVCSNGTKDNIDCSGAGADGLITSAKLTITGLNPGKKYQVYANLNQIGDQLTDGNRNPLDWNYAATEVVDA